MTNEKIIDTLVKFGKKHGYKMKDIERRTLLRTITTLRDFNYPEVRKNVISKKKFNQIIKIYGIQGIDFDSFSCTDLKDNRDY